MEAKKELWDDYEKYEKQIYKQAWKFQKQFTIYTIEDLFQEGFLVYAKCKEKYDPTKNVMFSTFLQTCLVRHFLSLLHYKEKGLKTTDWKNARENKTDIKTHRPICMGELKYGRSSHYNYINVAYEDRVKHLCRDDDHNLMIEYTDWTQKSCSIRDVKIILLSKEERELFKKAAPYISGEKKINWRTKKELLPKIRKCLLTW